METRSNKSVIENYFKAFSTGDLAAVLRIFHPECLIVSVHEGSRMHGQLHGAYRSRTQAKEFLENIANLFETQRFEVASVMEGDNNVVYANGTFLHKVKATGKPFYSSWVQRSVIKDGMIKEYRFYEDSAAYEKAAANSKENE